MERERVESFTAEVVETINSTFRMDMDEYARASWSRFIRDEVKTDDRLVSLMAVAMWDMVKNNPNRPTISDLRRYFYKAQADNPLPKEEVALPSETVPEWVKRKIVALVNSDFRVWPEQEPGYAYLHGEHGGETYLWPRQTPMPPEDRTSYEGLGMDLNPEKIARILSTAPRWKSR